MYFKIRKENNKIYVLEQSEHKLSDPDLFIEIENGEEIKKLLENGKEVILDNDLNIIKSVNKKYFGVDIKDKNKIKIVKIFKEKIDQYLKNTYFLDYLDIININDTFVNNGLFVTFENIDEIVEKTKEIDDLDLIEKADRLKQYYEEIKYPMEINEHFKRVLTEIKFLDDDDPKIFEILEKLEEL